MTTPIEMIRSNEVIIINYSKITITDDDIQILSEAISHNTSAIELRIDSVKMTDSQFLILYNGLVLRQRFHFINLRDNSLTDLSIPLIAEMVKKKMVLRLDIRDNAFTTLKNFTSLDRLNHNISVLHHSIVESDYLVDVMTDIHLGLYVDYIPKLRNNTIKTLPFFATHFEEKSAHMLAKEIRVNTSAKELDLALCDMDDDTLKIFFDAIVERMNKFSFIDISGNEDLTENSFVEILRLLKSNKVDDLNMKHVRAITTNRSLMEELIREAKAHNVNLYVDDFSREKTKSESSIDIFTHSFFKRRDIADVLKELECLQDDKIRKKVVSRFSPYMLNKLNEIIANESKCKFGAVNDLLGDINLFNSSLLSNMPLFISYKIADIIAELNSELTNQTADSLLGGLDNKRAELRIS